MRHECNRWVAETGLCSSVVTSSISARRTSVSKSILSIAIVSTCSYYSEVVQFIGSAGNPGAPRSTCLISNLSTQYLSNSTSSDNEVLQTSTLVSNVLSVVEKVMFQSLPFEICEDGLITLGFGLGCSFLH